MNPGKDPKIGILLASCVEKPMMPTTSETPELLVCCSA